MTRITPTGLPVMGAASRPTVRRVPTDDIHFSGIFRSSKIKNPVQPNIQNMKDDLAVLTKLVRNPRHLDDLNKAADHIRGQWEKLGLKVTEQPFDCDGKPCKNLVVSLGPDTKEHYVIGAHYDVHGDQPGADDNGSSVAGMLELTRMLVNNKTPLKTRLDLVAFSMEERPTVCLGSKAYVDKVVREEKAPVKGMISLDMIGYFSDKPKSQHFPSKIMNLVYPSKGNFIGVVGFGPSFQWMRKIKKAISNNSAMKAHMLYMPKNWFGVGRSDHQNFTEAGIPGAMVTDTAEHRNPNYHRKSDTMDTLDFDKMAEVVKGIYALTTQLK